MTEMSNKAKKFLASRERLSSTTNREEIIKTFVANEAPIFEPLIEFQQKYSSYKFMTGSEQIHLGILQGDGGYPIRTETAIIDFSLSESGTSKYQFVCATSEYPMQYTLDEEGRYYEDYKLVASSFNKIIEHLAIWEELKKNERFKLMIQNQKLDIQELDKKLGLTIIPEASDEYSLWFKNDLTYLTQCQGLATIITSEDFGKIKTLLNS